MLVPAPDVAARAQDLGGGAHEQHGHVLRYGGLRSRAAAACLPAACCMLRAELQSTLLYSSCVMACDVYCNTVCSDLTRARAVMQYQYLVLL